MELFNWLQDALSYRQMNQRRAELRRPGQGYDYTDEKYKDIVHRTVEHLHPKRMKLVVVEIIQETASTKTLRCRRTDGSLPPFRAGQYVNVFVTIGNVTTSRAYSISSSPGEDCIDLTIRNREDGFVAPFLLNEINIGDELESTGPAGGFYYESLIDGDDLVFLAGGSGITPFVAMLENFVHNGSAIKVHLLYGSRTPEDVIFAERLAKIAKAYPHLKVTLVISDPPEGYDGPTGFLDAKTIQQHVGDVAGKMFYLCGPNAMLDLCRSALKELGVLSHRMRSELYGPPADVTQEPGWPEEINANQEFNVKANGVSLKAKACEPLICSLERAGLVVPAVCRAGECSACRTKVLSGKVFMPSSVGLRESDRANGYIHACVAYPLSDLEVRF